MLLLAVSSPSFAQELIKASRPFVEAEFPRARVSGGLVVGAMFTRDTNRSAKPRLFAVLPQTYSIAGEACVSVTARDGTYEAANTYRIPAGSDGQRVEFEFPTAYGQLLARKEAVARLNIGGCEVEETPVVPVSWNPQDGAADGDQVLFFVNTGGAETLVAIPDDAGNDRVSRCEPVNDTRGLKYTAICSVAVDNLGLGQLRAVYLDVTRNRVVETYSFEVFHAGR